MPLCSPALWLTAAATLTTQISTTLPAREDLTATTWCYATEGGQNVESWSLKGDGSAHVTLHLKQGQRVAKTFENGSWKMKRNKFVLRVPKYKRRVLTIDTFAARRLVFQNRNQAVPCQPR